MLRVSVNLSAHQFRVGSVVQLVQDAIRTSGVDPSRMDVEITESALVSEHRGHREQLHEIREMGVGIALDDFGTGYSALGYLKSFPITQIKIDRMFVREIATDLQDAAITVRDRLAGARSRHRGHRGGRRDRAAARRARAAGMPADAGLSLRTPVPRRSSGGSCTSASSTGGRRPSGAEVGAATAVS
jgi:predicted signal transduction protein with EAL and GGDEF domain